MHEKYILEKIGFYKLWLTLLVAMDASTMAWFFNNADKIAMFKIKLIVLVILVLTASIAVLTRKARKMIKKLEV